MAMQNRRYINKMRRDAIGRSYRAGKKCGSYTESDIPPDASDICDSAADDEKTVQPEPKPPDRIRFKNKSGILEELLGSIDKDTLLIAAMLVLLMKDGGDKRLIIALGYILM